MLNFDSTGMYTILALIVNFKCDACKNERHRWNYLLFLAQCHYTKIAQKYWNIVLYNTPVLLRIKTEQFDI